MKTDKNELTNKFNVNYEFTNVDELVSFVETASIFLEDCELCSNGGLLYVRLKGDETLGIDFDRVFAYDCGGNLVGMVRQGQVYYFNPEEKQTAWLEPEEQKVFTNLDSELESKGLEYYKDIYTLPYLSDYFVLARDISKLTSYKECAWMVISGDNKENVMAGTFRGGKLVSLAANGCSFDTFTKYNQQWFEAQSQLVDGFYHSGRTFYNICLCARNPKTTGKFFLKENELVIEVLNGNIINISNPANGETVVFPDGSRIMVLLSDKTKEIPKGLTSDNVVYLSDYPELTATKEKPATEAIIMEEKEQTPTPEYNNPYWTGSFTRTFNRKGSYHSKNGEPAYVDDDRAYWLKDGKFHNLNGPAKIYYNTNGSPPKVEYWLNGQLTTKEIVDKERETLEKNLELYVLPYIEGNRIPTDDEVTEITRLDSAQVTKPGWYRVNQQYYWLENFVVYKKDAVGVVEFSMDTGMARAYRTSDNEARYSLAELQDAEAVLNCPKNASTEYRNCLDDVGSFFSTVEKNDPKETGAYKRFDPRTKTYTFFWIKDGKLHRKNDSAVVTPFTSVAALEGVVGEVDSKVFEETLQKFFKRAIRGYSREAVESDPAKKPNQSNNNEGKKTTMSGLDKINIRSEAEEVAYRTATNQLRGLIKNFLADRMGESVRGTKKQREETRKAALGFFDSEVGSLVITGALGALGPMAEEHIPGRYADYVTNLSKEFRVHAMAGMGNHLIDLVRENAGDLLSRSQSILDTLDAATVLEEAKKANNSGSTEPQQLVPSSAGAAIKQQR